MFITAREIERAFAARGVTVGPCLIVGHGIAWKYHHAPYYEDRWVRVYVSGDGARPVRLEDCGAIERDLVIAHILQRNPGLLEPQHED